MVLVFFLKSCSSPRLSPGSIKNLCAPGCDWFLQPATHESCSNSSCQHCFLSFLSNSPSLLASFLTCTTRRLHIPIACNHVLQLLPQLDASPSLLKRVPPLCGCTGFASCWSSFLGCVCCTSAASCDDSAAASCDRAAATAASCFVTTIDLAMSSAGWYREWLGTRILQSCKFVKARAASWSKPYIQRRPWSMPLLENFWSPPLLHKDQRPDEAHCQR